MINLLKKQLLPTILIIAIFLIFSPIIYSHTYLKTLNWQTDFNPHKLFAIDLSTQGMKNLPPFIIAHPVWQILLVIGNSITGFTFQKMGFIVALLCAEATALALLMWFRPLFEKNRISNWKAVIIIAGTMTATPVSVLWIIDHLMYLGYIGITSYHSPTMYLLKPFAVIQFIIAYKCFMDSALFERHHILTAAFISLLGTLIKPSLAICLLPAIGILAVNRILKKQYVNIQSVVFGFGVPIVLVLIWQFLITYSNNEVSGVEFAPFAVMRGYSKYVLPKFFLSIIFPLSVLLAAFKQALTDVRMVLGWISFIIGAILSYFFMESGNRAMDGNFIWSGEITLFLLFAISTLFYIDIPPGKKKSLLAVGWLLQVLSGVVYYFYCIFNDSYY
jgi:hypothetical protein